MLTGPLSCTAENNSLISILVLFSSKYILHVLKHKIIFRCFFHKNKKVGFMKYFTPLNEIIFSYCKTYYIIFPLKYFVSCFKNVSILILEIMRFVCMCVCAVYQAEYHLNVNIFALQNITILFPDTISSTHTCLLSLWIN